MANYSFVYYSDDLKELFDFCGITLTLKEVGGVRGWDYGPFTEALAAAQAYLDLHYEEDPETFDPYYEMFDYTQFYWSNEGMIIN